MSRPKSRHVKYKVAEGEHAGHRVVSDNYGIDFGGRDPRAAAYCLDCHESLVLVIDPATDKQPPPRVHEPEPG